MVGKSFKTIVITPTTNQKSDYSPMSQVIGFQHVESKKNNSTPNNCRSQSKSPPINHLSPSGSRNSPKNPMGTTRSSPKTFAGSPPSKFLMGDQHYAGAKFSDPPNPTKLPKPPSHWMGPEEMLTPTISIKKNKKTQLQHQGAKNGNNVGKQQQTTKAAVPTTPKYYPELFSSAAIKKAQNHMMNNPYNAASEGPIIVPEKNCKAMTNHLKLLLKVQG